jgi:hypothetical protein
MCHEDLPEAILLSPAFQRLHTIFRHDWLPVVPSEAIAQREYVLHTVSRHGGSIDHLRFNSKVLVSAEKRVVHKIAVVAGDVSGRPHRIEDLQIGFRHEAEGLSVLLSVDRRRAQCHGGGSRGRTLDELSATDAVHPHVPPYRGGDSALAIGYSITSSARASSAGGTSKPSAFAVLRLITSSNLVGCCTGRSPGLAPLRMRSTYDAAPRYMSTTSTP